MIKPSPSKKPNRIVHVQTPFRISFFGGGTDMPGYFEKAKGAVLGSTINRSSFVVVNSLERLFNKKLKLSYSKLEFANTPDEIDHPIVRETLRHYSDLWDNGCIDIHSFADMPSGSGIGSSSSFTVGLLTALYAMNGLYKSPKKLAREAIKVERELLGEAGGWQDQIFPPFGGMNKIEFSGNDFEVYPLHISPCLEDEFNASLLAFFTANQRSSASVQEKVFTQENMTKKNKFLAEMFELVNEAERLLLETEEPRQAIKKFGALLDHTWSLKRSLSSEISSNSIDLIYAKAMDAGAYGGKLSGAGGGSGLIYFLAPPENHAAIREALRSQDLHEVSIAIGAYRNRIIFAE